MIHDITMFSTADWDTPLWTNKQHVAKELARQGNRVLYVESFGLRRPSAKRRDIVRMFKRFTSSFRPPRLVSKNIWVWSPLVIPYHQFWIVRRLNRQILGLGLRIAQSRLHFHTDWLWTYSPITFAVYRPRGYDKVIYHCVDDISAQPGVASGYINSEDARTSTRSDIVFVTAPALELRHREFNKETYYFSNVADYDHFSVAQSFETEVADEMRMLRHPIIGFVGAISSYKLDFALLISAAKMRPDWSFVLIGEIGEGDPNTNIGELVELNNITLIKSQPYDRLPYFLKGFDVAIIPSLINQYTASMFPMKFFEYLAAGLRVVATPLDSLKGYSGVVEIASDATEFVDVLRRVLESRDVGIVERLAVAKANTYESRTAKMLALVERLPSRR